MSENQNSKVKTTSNFNQSRNENQQYDLVTIFQSFQTKINRDLNVATFALVESVKNDDVTCKPFPIREKTNSYSISAFLINENIEVKKGDIVLVIFTDRDYRNCINNINDNSNYTTDDSDLHSINYGVIISKIEKKSND